MAGFFRLKFSTYGSVFEPNCGRKVAFFIIFITTEVIQIDLATSNRHKLQTFLRNFQKFMPKGWKFLKNSVIQIGPFVKVQNHVESR